MKTSILAAMIAASAFASAQLLESFESLDSSNLTTVVNSASGRTYEISTDWASEGTKSVKFRNEGGFAWVQMDITGKKPIVNGGNTMRYDIHIPADQPSGYYCMINSLNSGAGWSQVQGPGQICVNDPGTCTASFEVFPGSTIWNNNFVDSPENGNWAQVFFSLNNSADAPRTVYYDNFRMVNLGTVTGQLNLEAFQGTKANVPLYVTFLEGGTGNFIDNASFRIDENGNYSVKTAATGPVDMYINGGTFLVKKVSTTVTAGAGVAPTVTLLNGDADLNNIVDFDDLSIIATNYELADGFDPRSDLDGVNGCDFDDLSIVATNYELAGE